MASNFTLNSGSYDGRYLKLYCVQTKDIANNKSKIDWTLSSLDGDVNYYSVGPTTVTIAGEQVYYKGRTAYTVKEFPSAKGSVSGTVYVDHDTKGEKSISVSLTTAIYTGTTSTYSGTWTLDSIPRQATITSAPDFTDLDNPVLQYSNPAGDSVAELMACISFTGSKDDIAYRAIPKTGTSYPFNFTEAERDVLRTNTSGNSRKLFFYVRTKVGTTTFYERKEVNFSIVESDATKPSVKMEWSLNNGSLPSKFDGLCIQGKSRYDITLSAEGKYGASITNYSALVDSKTYTSNPFTSDVLQSSGVVPIIGQATDSRGFSGQDSYYADAIAYSKPLVIPLGSENAIQCYRSDGNGQRVSKSTSVWIKAKRTFYSLDGKNLCALQWRKKLVTEEWNDSTHQWNTLLSKEASTDEYNALIPSAVFELKKSYTVQIRAVDDIGDFDVKTFEVPTEDVALHLGAGGKNVAVGTYCDYSKPYTFYSEWDAIFGADVYIGDVTLKDYILNIINEGG